MKKCLLRLDLTLMLIFCTTLLWAGDFTITSGSCPDKGAGIGTEDDPFIIKTTNDWIEFTNNVNNGINADAYYKLDKDLTIGSPEKPISTLVGDSKNHRFYGHFDGDGHTLTVYMDRTADYAAPFGIADGATFTNLNVEGTITTTHKFAGGIASYVYGPVYVTNCNSNINIISTVTSNSDCDGTHAGFVGQCEDGAIYFENCVFTGSIIDPAEPKQTIKCAGFLGWVNKEAHYTNCLQAGIIDVKANMATFHRKRNNASIHFTNAFYIKGFDDGQGTQVYDHLLENQIGRKYSINTTYYYVPGTSISGLKDTYTYAQGDIIPVTPVLTYFGDELVEDTDYAVSFQKKVNDEYVNINKTDITTIGNYKIIINGIGDFAGTYTSFFKVIDVAEGWHFLQELINSGTEIVLNKDYTANYDDIALVVNNDVIIDLNGHTIDRNMRETAVDGYVIMINDKVNITITDNSKGKNGTITGGKNLGNGGGIVNKGNLTVENINIIDNSCERNSNIWGTGGGIYSSGTLTMINCNVNNNEAYGGGGGIHAVGGLTIEGGNVNNNKSVSKGAGIRAAQSSTITGCTITYNSMNEGSNSKHGGGIFFDGIDNKKTLNITGCTITNNTAIDDGGGIFAIKGKVTAKDCTIENNHAGKLGNDICVYTNSIMTIEGDYKNTDSDNVFIYDKGQLFVPTSSTIAATVQKSVSAWESSSKTGWYTLASPVANQDFANVENLLSSTHNIYRYYAENTMWQEYRAAGNEYNVFENGRGYLYRKTIACNINYSGELNADNVSYNLEYTEGNEMKSYNLLGNPYSHNIYKGKNFSSDLLEDKYCILNENGTWEVIDDKQAIPVGTAFLVQAKEAKTLVMTNEETYSKERANNDNIWFTVANDDFKDVACVEFKNGHGFNKVAHRNEDAPMLYISHNGENFASADMSDDTKLINLNFKASKTGRYTLSYTANGNFSYMHIIDRLTGDDVDMLLEGEYSFLASSQDAENRFIVRLGYMPNYDAKNDNFAYQSGNDIVVTGEGTLQVFDMTGRMVMTQYINGVETQNFASLHTGVYIFKLNDKTQKIVVR